MIGIPLKHIVESYLIEERRDTKHYYLPYLHLANDGLQELHWDVNGLLETVELDIDPETLTVDLPDRFVKEARIAVLTTSGLLLPLHRNDDIFKDKDSCGNTINSAGTIDQDNRSMQYKSYGIGGKSTVGEFRIDYKTAKIWFRNINPASKIFLEYMTDMPDRINGQYRVHPFLKQPLLDYIDWASKRRIESPGIVDNLHRVYVNSKNWARQRFWNMDFEEVLQTARQNFKASPKY